MARRSPPGLGRGRSDGRRVPRPRLEPPTVGGQVPQEPLIRHVPPKCPDGFSGTHRAKIVVRPPRPKAYTRIFPDNERRRVGIETLRRWQARGLKGTAEAMYERLT